MKPEDMLNDEVAPKEIIKYLDEKYDVYKIYDQKTIKRWFDENGIECIQPRPPRNKDIRYRKSDVLKIEEIKRSKLLQRAEKKIKDRELDLLARGERIKVQEHYDQLSSMTTDERKEEDIDQMYNYRSQALEQIRQDKLEMCFKKLFPKTSFDEKQLENILFILGEQTMHSDLEIGQAQLDLTHKKYIKQLRK